MNRINIYILAFLVISGCLISCTDEVLEEQPPHIITAESLYKNLEGFEAGLNGLYSLVREERVGQMHDGYNHLRAEMMMNGNDNMAPNIRDGFGGVAEVWKEFNHPFHENIEGNFIWLYEIINAANTIVNRADDEDINWLGNGKTAQENKNRVVAEAKALRGWAYRHLAYLWGGVPITLDESKGSTIKTDWVRSSENEVWRQVIRDFTDAEPFIGDEPVFPGRISKGAVQHYLSEIYLVLGKADSALYWADECINNPAYGLITERYGVNADKPGVPFMDMFYHGNSNREEGNSEALWVFQFELETIGGSGSIMRRWHGSRYQDISIEGVKPLEITVDRGGRAQARMSLTKFALELYEPQDDRFSEYAIRKFFVLKDADENDTGKADELPEGYNYGDTIWLDWSEDITDDNKSRHAWPYSEKWHWAYAGNVTEALQFNDQVYLRLAETYLVKAEAQLMLGNAAGAAETINIIRQRSNATEVAAGDVDIDFILDERSRELLVEEHRRYTLLRTGKWLERTSMYNHNGGQNITPRDTVFPIPQSVIDANLSTPMEQNPGY